MDQNCQKTSKDTTCKSRKVRENTDTMSEEKGASFKEQILDAARRNNTDLLNEILTQLASEDGKEAASTINDSRDPLGNTPLHLAAQYGNYEVLDLLLDQHGVEVDPVNNLDSDTPLHLAVRYAITEPEHGNFIVETLIDAGSDAKLRNKAGQKPLDLVRDDNPQLVDILQSAEYAQDEIEEGETVAQQHVENDDDNEDGTGSASASDDDE